MKVDIELERSIEVPVPLAQARALLDDVEAAVSRFPKLKKLTRLGPDQYLWELQTIGSRLARIAYDATYGARYQRSADGSQVSWEPIAGRGNASIAGALRVLEHARGAQIRFHVRGELRDVPVPLMYRLAAPPFIQGKFNSLIDTFLERTRDALVAPAAPTKKRAAAR